MEPRRLAAGQLGPLCIHALNRRSGRRPFPRSPFSERVTDWRSGAGGTEALAGQMDRAAAPWTPALHPGAAPRNRLGPVPARDWHLRIAQRSQGEGGFPLFPKTTPLIAREMPPTSPTALRLARLPALVRFPRSRCGPCQEHHIAAPPQIFWRKREEGKKSCI